MKQITESEYNRLEAAASILLEQRYVYQVNDGWTPTCAAGPVADKRLHAAARELVELGYTYVNDEWKAPAVGHDIAKRLSAIRGLEALGYTWRNNGWIAPQVTWRVAEGNTDEGYKSLADVLHRAYLQAATGKGKERHAQEGEPFEEQVMQDMARRFGIGSLLAQAFKKSEESQRLPTDSAVRELLGAINYLAGGVIAREKS